MSILPDLPAASQRYIGFDADGNGNRRFRLRLHRASLNRAQLPPAVALGKDAEELVLTG